MQEFKNTQKKEMTIPRRQEPTSATELLFLADAFLLEASATVRTVDRSEDGSKLVVSFDRTIFYPKGGGQPSDTGVIAFDSAEYRVENVELTPDGTVQHTLHPEPFSGAALREISPTSNVQLSVDDVSRSEHSRYHSAGHLLDLAVQLSELKRPPIKGNHSPHEAWVQFEGGTLPDGMTSDQAQEQISEILKELCDKNISTTTYELSAEQSRKQGIDAPAGKKARVLSFAGYEDLARGCGGTHVRSTSELRGLEITRFRCRKGKMSISYKISSQEEK